MVSLSEFTHALMSMKCGTLPGPDGVVLEFFKEFWLLICNDYYAMITQAVGDGNFPPVVTKGLIAFLHKGGARIKLTNWQPITLLNVSYKIFAKALQLRLQPVLMEMISHDQSAFLPMQFILDNILLTQGTMVWRGLRNRI
jgi:hypothetical protein